MTMHPPDPALLSLNTATVRTQWTMPEIIDGCVRHGIGRISPWRDQVAKAGLAETVQRIRDAGLALSGYCRGGMFPAPDAAGLAAAHDDNRRAVDEALALGAPCLVLVVGGLPRDAQERPASKDIAGARAMVRDGIARLLDYARPAGMPLAIEPLHPMYAADRACVNTIAHANALCDELGDGLGIAVDVYHVWWDPDLQREIARAGRARSGPERVAAPCLPPLRLAGPDAGPAARPWDDGRWRHRHSPDPFMDGKCRLPRPARSRDLLGGQLVEAGSRRSPRHVQGAARKRLLTHSGSRTRSARALDSGFVGAA